MASMHCIVGEHGGSPLRSMFCIAPMANTVSHARTPSPLHPFAPSPLHSFTRSPLHPLTPSPLHPFTPSPGHLVTLSPRQPCHRTYAATSPPSTFRMPPVVLDERSDAKNRMAWAMSSG